MWSKQMTRGLDLEPSQANQRIFSLSPLHLYQSLLRTGLESLVSLVAIRTERKVRQDRCVREGWLRRKRIGNPSGFHKPGRLGRPSRSERGLGFEKTPGLSKATIVPVGVQKELLEIRTMSYHLWLCLALLQSDMSVPHSCAPRKTRASVVMFLGMASSEQGRLSVLRGWQFCCRVAFYTAREAMTDENGRVQVCGGQTRLKTPGT
ncbi:hypothetical protein VTI28DRAFT_1489 [Corynascus sepedonium]